MSLAFKDIDHSFGTQRVLQGVNLTAAPGEIVCLLGASGSGKTTLLRLAAGLEALQAGSISLGATTLASATVHVLPEQRGVGLVFQDHVLYPHLTVAQNVAFGLHKATSAQRQQMVAQQLQAVGLAGLEGRYPHTLSGGQQQRVALARALAPQPRVMLLDEPFASVDSALRRRLRQQARLALKASNAITLIVTHDAEEALQLGDRIAYLVDGKIAQFDHPERFWQAPANAAVALAFGDAQGIPAAVDGGSVVTAFGTLPVLDLLDQRQHTDSVQAKLVLRPAALTVSMASVAADANAQVVDRRFAGDGVALLLRSLASPEHELLRALVPDPADAQALLPGCTVHVQFAPSQAFLFDVT